MEFQELKIHLDLWIKSKKQNLLFFTATYPPRPFIYIYIYILSLNISLSHFSFAPPFCCLFPFNVMLHTICYWLLFHLSIVYLCRLLHVQASLSSLSFFRSPNWLIKENMEWKIIRNLNLKLLPYLQTIISDAHTK